MLALGNATKARFNLVPYGGGNPTSVAVMNGEADAGALPIAGVVALGDQMRVLGVFNDDAAKMAKYSGNAPAVNKVFGTKIPPLYSSRSWAIHTEVIEKFPERFALLEDRAPGVRQPEVPRRSTPRPARRGDHPVRRPQALQSTPRA